MNNTIDMQVMRYINLFEKVCRVSTTSCFVYNNTIIFAVPSSQVFRAVGKNGVNMKKLSEILRKKIKVVKKPEGIESIEEFVKEIVDPVDFNKIEVKDGVVILTAGRQYKAALIGRNRVREQELEDILKKTFSNISKLKIL